MATVEAAARAELLEATDDQIVKAVGYADPMVLRGLLYQLTADPELKTMSLKKVRFGRVEAVAPATDADTAMLREKAVAYLQRLRDSGGANVDPGPTDRINQSLDLVVGEYIRDEARDLMREETGIDPWARSHEWRANPDPKALEDFTVTIIGAGMGGLNSALQLKRAGIRFQVIEKNQNVGGTWYENHYPGARVDTPSRAYTNLFGVDFPYPYAYGPHFENQRYYDWVADNFDLRKDIAFNTDVRSLTWDEEAGEWEIFISGPDGDRLIRSRAVVSGVGFLSRPNIPDLPGMDLFKGEAWHTARWPEGKDLAGKKIAVVGTGCTGYQLIPELAKLEGTELVVFQRTAQWIFPVPGYQSKIREEVLWLDRNLPLHTNFMRFKSFYGAGPDFVNIFDIDPDFEDEYTCSEANKQARDRAIEFLEDKIKDPELVAKMIPPHPPWSSRPVVVDPEDCVLQAIQQDNVTLVTSGVQRLTESAIVDDDGVHHEVDVIVWATGFKAHDFLYPMTVTGRDGMTLDRLWEKDGARAYLGCMMPGFPNLWVLYGPNTNGGLPVSQYHEMTMVYGMKCMEKLILDGKHAMDVNEDAFWRYNRDVDEGNARKLWADPRAQNYWWSKHGRTVSQTPFTGYQIRDHLKQPDWNDLKID